MPWRMALPSMPAGPGDRRGVPRRVHRPATPHRHGRRQSRHFHALATLSPAAITQGRAYYWLGRTADARHDPAGARQAYAAAAAWPTTFYGQLAARALGEDDAALAARIRSARDPGWTPERALDFAGSENARAAALLVEWGEARRARSFILRLDEIATDGTDRTLAARLAVGFGLPDLAVAIARRAAATA